MLPSDAADLLEVALVELVLLWTLGEALVVDSIDALFARRRRFRTRRDEELAKLRLRSLRLIGRVVVVLGLALSLSDLLVGEGTIFHWVLRASYYAAIPVALVLIQWWKPHVFDRIGRRRKHTALTGWLHARSSGVLSFAAASVGAVYLASRWLSRTARGWATGFDLSRRFLAYWFRRELTKKEESESDSAGEPLSGRPYDELDPEGPTDTLVENITDEQVARVIERIETAGGGVYAMVGERGGGKTTILRRILKRCSGRFIACPFGGVTPFFDALAEALDLPEESGLASITDCLNDADDDAALLIDDAAPSRSARHRRLRCFRSHPRRGARFIDPQLHLGVRAG